MEIEKEDPRLAKLVELGILERVAVHPTNPGEYMYRMPDPEGVRRALEDLGLLPRRN